MKVSVQRIEEFTSGSIQETAASIKANGKVMLSLIRNLYTIPVRAAIRETLQNHLDEHYRLDLDRPIEIHAPTILDPVWRSRDFGASMSPDFMLANKGGYMEIGHSTRETDVRQAGAWGYGKLAALAYTDQATVRCVQNHRYWTYIVKLKTIDAPDGSWDTRPTIALVDEGRTSEPGGTEMSWAVAHKDASRFQSELRLVLAGMFDRVMPVVIEGGAPTNRFDPDFEVLQSGKDWRLVKEGLINRAYARVVNVMYPLDSTALPSLKDAVRNLLGTPLILDFTPMEVHIPPSRDGLEYSDKTVKAVESKLTQVCDELVSEVQQAVDACGSKWEATKVFQARREGQSRIMQDLYKIAITWQGQPLPVGNFHIPKFLTEYDRTLQVRYTHSDAIKTGVYPRNQTYGQLQRNGPQIRTDQPFLIYLQHPDPKLKYAADRLIDDVRTRCTEFTQILWIKAEAGDPEMRRLIDHYGLPDDQVITINKLPMPANWQPPQKASGPRPKFTVINGLQCSRRRLTSIKIPASDTTPRIYLAVDDDRNPSAMAPSGRQIGGRYDRGDFGYNFNRYIPGDIICLRPKELAKIQGMAHWQSVWDVIRNWARQQTIDHKAYQAEADWQFVSNDSFVRFLVKNEDLFADHPEIRKVIETCKSVAKPQGADIDTQKNGLQYFSRFIPNLGTVPDSTASSSIVDRVEEIKSKYPVIEYVSQKEYSYYSGLGDERKSLIRHYLSLFKA